MPRLIAAFLRHGEYHQSKDVPSAHQPYELMPTGHIQARQGAKLIHSFCQENSLAIHQDIDSSTLLRAWQTADEIKTYLQEKYSDSLHINSHEDLCERSVGSVANLSIAQIEKLLDEDPRFDTPPQNWKSDSHYCLPFQGAESLLTSGNRVTNYIKQSLCNIKPQLTQDTLKIFIGHGASFRHAAYYLKLIKFEQISKLSMYHAQPIFFEYHANNDYQHITGQWKIRIHKDSSHID